MGRDRGAPAGSACGPVGLEWPCARRRGPSAAFRLPAWARRRGDPPGGGPTPHPAEPGDPCAAVLHPAVPVDAVRPRPALAVGDPARPAGSHRLGGRLPRPSPPPGVELRQDVRSHGGPPADDLRRRLDHRDRCGSAVVRHPGDRAGGRDVDLRRGDHRHGSPADGRHVHRQDRDLLADGGVPDVPDRQRHDPLERRTRRPAARSRGRSAFQGSCAGTSRSPGTCARGPERCGTAGPPRRLR